MELVDDFMFGGKRKDIIKFLGGGLLIDTGPLYLLIVGRYDKINRAKLLDHMSYSLEDFYVLGDLVSHLNCNKLIITPHIFTEFMSHLWKATHDKKVIPDIINQDNFLDKLTEKEISKDIIQSHEYVTKLEIGDLSLYIARENYEINAILSDDARFSNFFVKDNKTLLINFSKFKKFSNTSPQEWN